MFLRPNLACIEYFKYELLRHSFTTCLLFLVCGCSHARTASQVSLLQQIIWPQPLKCVSFGPFEIVKGLMNGRCGKICLQELPTVSLSWQNECFSFYNYPCHTYMHTYTHYIKFKDFGSQFLVWQWPESYLHCFFLIISLMVS
jgi:hypothetical protein